MLRLLQIILQQPPGFPARTRMFRGVFAAPGGIRQNRIPTLML